ncbi:MAG: glycosyltransferase family 4 protein [Clostridia bacterium]|nr:glycosyltransferase family 4 protein [Clostridia bacterium]
MKKVLFTATVDSHILQFHLPYLRMFKENGYEVHVATNGTEKIPYCDKKHKISFEKSPLKVNNLKAIKDLKRIIEKEKFEIIHCHTPMGSVVTRIAAKKARKRGTRVIYTAHGFHFFKGAPLKNWLIFYTVEKYLARYTDCLITINGEDYEIARKKFKTKQIELIPGVGIDEEKFGIEMNEGEKLELRKSLGLEKDDFVIIYPAELSIRKNQRMAIEVVKELTKINKNIKLLLPGLDSMNGKYQTMVKEYNLDENIKFLGYRKDIPRLMKISNLAISTAKQEGLPVNIMEAMYNGIPCVVTNCRGNRDLIHNGENGVVVEINNVARMIKEIQKILNGPKFIEQAKEEDKKYINYYLLKNVERKMKQIYLKRGSDYEKSIYYNGDL